MTVAYAEFLTAKTRQVQPAGLPCTPDDVHPHLHPWQRDVVAWAVRTGRAALWEDTGLGKTVQMLEFCRLAGRTALVVAPLAVCAQTIREATHLNLEVRFTPDGQIGPGIWITNYERFDRVDPAQLDVVVLDEASILKQSTGVTRTALIDHFRTVPYRLACTATPAPNDAEELTNQAAFLGVASRVEMLSAYFINDGKTWRVKGHARGPMFRWMAGWALALRRPSDLGPGHSDDGYALPPLRIIPEVVDTGLVPVEGQLFGTPADLGGVGGRAKVRRATLDARCERAAKLVCDEPDEQWLLWRSLIPEADRLKALIPDAVDVRGKWSPEQKAEAYLAFASGQVRHLITEPGMAAYGLNLQSCARMAFVGLGDSYERYYQAIRRCWRYGQTRAVHAHVVLSELESAIADNVARKEREAAQLMSDLVTAMRGADRSGVAA